MKLKLTVFLIPLSSKESSPLPCYLVTSLLSSPSGRVLSQGFALHVLSPDDFHARWRRGECIGESYNYVRYQTVTTVIYLGTQGVF